MAENFFSAVLGDKGSPKPQYLTGTKPGAKSLAALGTKTIGNLGLAADEASRRSTEGLARNDALLDQQASIWQGLLNKPQMDPLGTYGAVGDKLFSYIQPNVLDPIARFNVNQGRVNSRALGLSPDALTSTSQRLFDAANANRAYLDVAKSVIPQINPGFNQVFNAGLARDQSDVQRAGFIPQLIASYQNQALAPLIPASAAANAWNMASQGYGTQAENIMKSIYGWKQPQNAWDRAGAGVDAIMNRVGQVASIYGSLGGGGMGSGEGGGVPSGGDGGTIAIGGGNYDNRRGAGWG